MYFGEIQNPRTDINKRADIVILRPGEDSIGMGHVDSKEVDCIWTSFEDCKFLNEKAKWNQDWKWTFGTHRGLYGWCPWKNTEKVKYIYVWTWQIWTLLSMCSRI